MRSRTAHKAAFWTWQCAGISRRGEVAALRRDRRARSSVCEGAPVFPCRNKADLVQGWVLGFVTGRSALALPSTEFRVRKSRCRYLLKMFLAEGAHFA